MPTATKFYAVVTSGCPAKRLPASCRTMDRAVKLAGESVRTGTCTEVRVYECDTRALAWSADISGLRDGECQVWAST